MRSVRYQRDGEEYIKYIQRGYRHYKMQASFSFETGFENSDTDDVLNDSSNDLKYLRVRFHEQLVGDSSGDAPISVAFFRIGPQQMSRPRRSSRTSKKYRKPVSCSSKRQTVGETVNWNSINGWLKSCRESHSIRCQCTIGPHPLQRPARVIDVQNHCIVEAPIGEYLTLSYVWGQKTKSNPIRTALKSNIKFLQKPGALSKLGLPKTISDAMYACDQLGSRYLWVDSLCIVQDDENDVKDQIACMSDIYSGAFLTIIAASGDHSNSGLPGVLWGPPRVPQLVANFDGVEMIEVLPLLDDVLRYSKWRSRAWT